jgi:spore photoproduct lyase
VTSYKFNQIFIDEQVRGDEITIQVLDAYPAIKPNYLNDSDKINDILLSLAANQGKKTLWLTRFKGKFLKPCPGTAESYRCCNYLVINETTNCPIDCSYCILQEYINNPAITVYTNYSQILTEIRTLSQYNPHRILRIGTGELTDSLALDPVTGLSEKLIREIQQLPNVLLELKTKTENVEHLLHLNPEKVVLSWSVNPEQLVKTEEHRSAGILKRLESAQKAVQKGYLIGFHFDPIIYSNNWESDYVKLIDTMSACLPDENIAWISLGALRYPTLLKQIARNRFPSSPIFSGEQITGKDGKTRYLRPLRQKMFEVIYNQLHSVWPKAFIYFCMESEEIWKTVSGRSPKNNLDVDWLFAESLYQKFPKLRLPKPEKQIYQEIIKFN